VGGGTGVTAAPGACAGVVAPGWAAGAAADGVLDAAGGFRHAAPPHAMAATRTVDRALVKTGTSTVEFR
jgi:hypothetical protein